MLRLSHSPELGFLRFLIDRETCGRFGVDDSQFDHPFVASFADRVVSVVVHAFVLLDVFLECVHRPVGRSETDIKEERLVAGFVVMFLNESARVIGDRVGVVERSIGLLFRAVLRIACG